MFGYFKAINDDNTLVETAEHMFVRRLLKNQCPTTTFNSEWDDKDVIMYEFNFQLCCDGSICVMAYIDENSEFVIVKSFLRNR